MSKENIKGVIDLKDVDTDLRSHIENLEGKGIRQQIEDIKTEDYSTITESQFMQYLDKLNKQKPYRDPTDHMSQKQKQQFHSYLQESFKKAKEDGY